MSIYLGKNFLIVRQRRGGSSAALIMGTRHDRWKIEQD